MSQNSSIVGSELLSSPRSPLDSSLVSEAMAFEGDSVMSEHSEVLEVDEITTFPAQSMARSQILPLRRENMRITRSNNAMHLRLIQQGQEHKAETQRYEAENRQLTSSVTDLKFLNTQKTKQLRTQEAVITDLRERVDQTLKHKGRYSQQAREISSFVDEPEEGANTLSNSRSRPSTSAYASSSAVDIVAASSHQVERLLEQLKSYQNREVAYKEREARFTSDLSARNTEIERLAVLLETERNWDRLESDERIADLHLAVKKLNAQVDFLNEERVQLEQKLERYEEHGPSRLEDKEEVMAQKEETQRMRTLFDAAKEDGDLLREDLQAARELAAKRQEALKLLEARSNENAVKSSEEVRLLRSKYESVLFESEESRRELGGAKHAESLKDQMERRVQEQTSSLRIKLDSREQELGQVREQYEALLLAQDGLKREFTHVRTELALVRDKYDTETRTLQGDVEQANETCRALLDKYKGISGKHSGLESEKSELLDAMSALQTVQQSLLHEREYYKNQIEVLNETLREQKTAAASSEADGSVISKHAAELETALASQREERKKLLLEVSAGEMRVQKLTQELYDARNESFGLKAKAVNADAFQKDSRTAKQQREELQLEKEQVERQLVQCRAQVATSEQEEAGLVARNGELVANLEVLTATVQEYDEQLLVIQSEIRALVEERDTVQFKHDQLLAELAVRDGAQRNTEEEQSKQLSAVRDLRKANQELSFALWSKEQELDNRTKLVHAEAQKSSGLSAARQQLTLDLGGRAEELALCQEEIKALRDEIRSMRQVLAERERETEHVRADLVAATEVGEQRRAQVEELKSLCRQVDSTREDCEVALRELVSHKERLEGELLEARHTGAEHEGQRTANEHEAAQLREVLGSLAAERDHLRLAVEDAGRGQSRATLDQQAARRKQEETASVASSARLQIEAQMQELNRKDVRIAQLNEHSEALNLELTRVSEEYALNSRELSAVLEDLGNMIKENQFVNQELAQTQEHRDQRAQDVEHLAARVSGLEEGWAATDREKQDLLSTYRAACAEIERIKMTAQEVEEERYRHRTQTAHLQEHCARLEVHVQELLREREQTMIDFEAFENQNELVSRQLETTKYQLDQALGATDLMTRDVSSAREVSHAIEGKRNDMVREIGELNHANRDLTVQLLRATAEGKALQARWDLESKRASQLEVLLSEMRVQMHRSEGERQTSTSATQSEFEVMLNEVRALREHNGGLKEQLETAHKYRERQAAEIKGLLRTMTTRLSSTTATANTTDASEATAIAQRQDRETVWSAMNGKVGSLQVSLAEQFRSVQDLQEERADLRSTLMKYEQALAKYESTRRSARGDTRPESPSSDPSD